MFLKISRHMKMAALVEADPRILAILSRMGISDSFGEMTVDEICIRNGLDTDTFILLCQVYVFPEYKPSEDLLRRAHISDVLRYLHKSHDYYTDTALVRITEAIDRLVEPCQEVQKKVILKFLADYETELRKHFEYEESRVIPYIQDLLLGRQTPGFSICRFEEEHTEVDGKLSDLKNIVMKSLPSVCEPEARIELLQFLFSLREDLDRHTRIEDDVMVPMVRLIENPHQGNPRRVRQAEEEDDEREELSGREKEILVSVALGLTNKEIADKHNISVNTVITHRRNISRKTGIKTVAGMTLYAILNDLIDLNSIE